MLSSVPNRHDRAWRQCEDHTFRIIIHNPGRGIGRDLVRQTGAAIVEQQQVARVEVAGQHRARVLASSRPASWLPAGQAPRVEGVEVVDLPI